MKNKTVHFANLPFNLSTFISYFFMHSLRDKITTIIIYYIGSIHLTFVICSIKFCLFYTSRSEILFRFWNIHFSYCHMSWFLNLSETIVGEFWLQGNKFKKSANLFFSNNRKKGAGCLDKDPLRTIICSNLREFMQVIVKYHLWP
jgi:hypothetical protein